MKGLACVTKAHLIKLVNHLWQSFFFEKTVKGLEKLLFSQKSSIIDVWQGCKYSCAFYTVIAWLTPTNIYLFKVKNRNTRKRCEIRSKLTIKTPKRRHKNTRTKSYITPFSSAPIVNFAKVNVSWLPIWVIRIYLVFIRFVNSFDIFVFITPWYEILRVIPSRRVLKGTLSKINGGTVFSKCQTLMVGLFSQNVP